MIRPVTCLAFLLACGSGLYLYQAKHRVKVLDDQIATMMKSTDTLREQTRMLSAEWTLLNDPERLRQLANQFLALQTVSPNQFTSLADLDSRLPPPIPQAAPPAPAATEPVVAEQVPAVPGAAGNRDAATPPTAVTVAAPSVMAVATSALPEAPAAAHRDVASAKDAGHGGAASSGTASIVAASSRTAPVADHVTDHHTAPDLLARATDRHVSPRPLAPMPRIAANPPRAPEFRGDRYAPPVQHEVAQRTFVPNSMERRPMMAGQTAPMASGGSLLGMAHDVPAPPAPMPIGGPVQMTTPVSFGGGTTGG